jgi:hypothetical protein
MISINVACIGALLLWKYLSYLFLKYGLSEILLIVVNLKVFKVAEEGYLAKLLNVLSEQNRNQKH